MPQLGETEADEVFREDARRLGYLVDSPHEPGGGRGLYAYYRDHGMVPPNPSVEHRRSKIEITGVDLEKF